MPYRNAISMDRVGGYDYTVEVKTITTIHKSTKSAQNCVAKGSTTQITLTNSVHTCTYTRSTHMML